MGAYAQSQHIQGRMVRFPSGAATALTPEHIDEIILEIEGEIDMVLAGRDVAVPVAAPAWFVARLRSLTSDGATAISLKSMFPEVSGPGSTPAYAYYETRYRQGLLQLGRMALPPSVVTATRALEPATYFTVNPDVPAIYGDHAEGQFGMERVF